MEVREFGWRGIVVGLVVEAGGKDGEWLSWLVGQVVGCTALRW